jgi:hypothetical protein
MSYSLARTGPTAFVPDEVTPLRAMVDSTPTNNSTTVLTDYIHSLLFNFAPTLQTAFVATSDIINVRQIASPHPIW